MLDVDIPLNAGCLVPITSTEALLTHALLPAHNPQLRYPSIRYSRHRVLQLSVLGTFSRRSE
jgi:hypothetical protein